VKEKKIYLECGEILFAKILIAIAGGMFAAICVGLLIVLEIKETAWRRDPLVLGGFVFGILFSALLIVRGGPFPYVFTRLFTDENELVIKRLNKRYVYRFADVKEIAALPKREFLSKRKTICFVVSKRKGLASETGKIKSPSFVGEEFFVVSRHSLENIKPLLQYYRREREFVNMDIYEDYFLDEELEFLRTL
jgi:hypothetical protein